MNRIVQSLVLPTEISDFERRYLGRQNAIAKWFFALHVPAFVLVAWACDTGPLMALGMTLAALVVPFTAPSVFDNPRHVSISHGFTSMILGGLLVHFGQGPVQIEMHFYFFASLAMLAVFGNPMVVVVAAVTVAAHHGLLWWYLPSSVFNYDAPFWVVAVHAAFVVLESVATCFIARSFFDNVIGLEKIVQARTSALDARNREMRVVMDNVQQGFVTIAGDGTMAEERSAIVQDFLGASRPGETFEQYVARASERFAAQFAMGWDQLTDGFLPLDVCLGQLPTSFERGERYFRLQYIPVTCSDGHLDQLLIVLSDVTADVERERFEAESKEVMGIFERVMRDKTGFLEFFEEASLLVQQIGDDKIADAGHLKRALHTLKGNSMIFGIHTVADLCHAMEDALDEDEQRPSPEARHELNVRWDHLRKNLDAILGERGDKFVEVSDREYRETLHWVLSDGVSKTEIAERIASWKLEHTAVRLERIAEQAHAIARRLNKGDVEINIEGSDLRLEPEHWASFWSSFIHVVRNAVDHGLEPREGMSLTEKKPRIELLTRTEGDEFIIALEDNGRGIDWNRIADKANSLGLPANDQDDLVEALFAEGMSTKDEATEFSGRGVGMGAVRQECAARNGRVRVVSEPGKGTTVEFRFPISEMAQLPQRAA